MTAQHFILWVEGERTHVATRNAYRRGRASWLNDEAHSVPEELVMAHGFESWGTPINGPHPAFAAEKMPLMAQWLLDHGYTAVILDEPPT